MFKKNSIKRRFVSEIDRFLIKFNQAHPPSASQQAEINKYRAIYQKRDHSSVTPGKPDHLDLMWD